jgi:ribonuclease BN (tRNA processing enzyme)
MASDNPDITITILGSGTCVPSLRRSSCSVLMATGGRQLLFDCGAGTMHRLLQAGTTIFDLDAVLFSHLHPDHSGELVALLFATKYPDNTRRHKPLRLAAGRGFSDFFQKLQAVYGHWIELDPGSLVIEEFDTVAPDSRGFGAAGVETRPMAHNPESVAYRVNGPGGRSVVYSGDTDVTDELVALSRGADLLICEAALPDEMRVPGHLTPALAGEIAARAGVERLLLTHFYPECDAADAFAQCRRVWSGPLTLAEDLMQIDL